MNTLNIIGGPRFIRKCEEFLNRMGHDFRVELADFGNVLARLPKEGLEPQVKTVLGINLLDVILQKRVHLFDKKDFVCLREVFEEEALGKGPCRSHLEDPYVVLNAQVDDCLQ